MLPSLKLSIFIVNERSYFHIRIILSIRTIKQKVIEYSKTNNKQNNKKNNPKFTFFCKQNICSKRKSKITENKKRKRDI